VAGRVAALVLVVPTPPVVSCWWIRSIWRGPFPFGAAAAIVVWY
jgi:hypothetical protein